MLSDPVISPAIIFSDSIIRDQLTGKLTLIGIFQRFISTKLPFTAPRFYTTVLLTNMAGQIGELPVSLVIEDAAGGVLTTTAGVVTAKSGAVLNDVAEICFPVEPITFQNRASYKVNVFVKSELVASRGFVVEVQQA